MSPKLVIQLVRWIRPSKLNRLRLGLEQTGRSPRADLEARASAGDHRAVQLIQDGDLSVPIPR